MVSPKKLWRKPIKEGVPRPDCHQTLFSIVWEYVQGANLQMNVRGKQVTNCDVPWCWGKVNYLAPRT